MQRRDFFKALAGMVIGALLSLLWPFPTKVRKDPPKWSGMKRAHVPTYDIGKSINWQLEYCNDTRWDVVSRAMETLRKDFDKKTKVLPPRWKSDPIDIWWDDDKKAWREYAAYTMPGCTRVPNKTIFGDPIFLGHSAFPLEA